MSNRAIAVATPKLWNSLPNQIRTAPTLTIFKSKSLKTFLFDLAYNLWCVALLFMLHLYICDFVPAWMNFMVMSVIYDFLYHTLVNGICFQLCFINKLKLELNWFFSKALKIDTFFFVF